MPQMWVMEPLENAKVSVYLLGIIRVYLWDQVLLVQTVSGMIRKEVACGVPQGSVLGPVLWNIAVDDVLKEDVPLEGSIICHADDTLVLIAEDDIPTLEQKGSTTLKATTFWINSAGLNRAILKMEAMLFKRHH